MSINFDIKNHAGKNGAIRGDHLLCLEASLVNFLWAFLLALYCLSAYYAHMNIETFREDLRQAIVKHGLSQCELARVSGVGQYNISRFLNPPERNGRSERDMKLSVAMKLWPFVYGCDFTPATPATQRGGEDVA